MNIIFKPLKGKKLLLFLVFAGLMATGRLFAVAPAMAAGPAPVNLLSADNFVILSETGITDTGSHSAVITGNIGASPITAAAMNDVFCSEVTGQIYGVDSAYTGSGITTCFAGNPPLANKTLVDNAVLDMGTAYTDAAGRTDPTATELGAGNIGGMTLAPGLYKWSTDVTIPTSVTLSGGPNDVWIFQIAGNLNIASAGSVPAGVKVILSGGAQASNVFWQVGGVTGATLGTYSTFNGNILSAKQVIIQTGAVLNGRALAQTQVTLDANAISDPPTSTTGVLTVNKIVSGGTATSSDFSIHVKNGANEVSNSPQPGSSQGTTYSDLSPGDYAVSEIGGPLNYSPFFSGDCNFQGVVFLTAGQIATCTMINSFNSSTSSTSTIFTLTVTKSGDGTGVVSSDEQQGIDCGGVCTQVYASGTVVTLTVAPDPNSNFSDTWSGAGCSGNGSCIVTVTGNTIVNANLSLNAPSGGTTGTISGTVFSGSQVTGTLSGGSLGSTVSGTITGGSVGSSLSGTVTGGGTGGSGSGGGSSGGGSSSGSGTGVSTSGGGSSGSVNDSDPSGGSVLGASTVVPDPILPIGGVAAGEPINPWNSNGLVIILSLIVIAAFIVYAVIKLLSLGA